MPFNCIYIGHADVIVCIMLLSITDPERKPQAQDEENSAHFTPHLLLPILHVLKHVYTVVHDGVEHILVVVHTLTHKGQVAEDAGQQLLVSWGEAVVLPLGPFHLLLDVGAGDTTADRTEAV